MLKWLHSQGCPWIYENEYLIHHAKSHVAIIEWLKRIPFHHQPYPDQYDAETELSIKISSDLYKRLNRRNGHV